MWYILDSYRTLVRRFRFDLGREAVASQETLKQHAADVLMTLSALGRFFDVLREFHAGSHDREADGLLHDVEQLQARFKKIADLLTEAPKTKSTGKSKKGRPAEVLDETRAKVGQLLTDAERVMERAEALCSRGGSRVPGARARIFLGSSTPSLSVARAVKAQFEYEKNFEVHIWNESPVFRELGKTNIEALENAITKYDYAVFIFTPDDRAKKGGKSVGLTRDNVVFELGLFVGKLGRTRSFVIHPRESKLSLPTDLHGLLVATYDGSRDLPGAVGEACDQLREAIRSQELQTALGA